jgi:hypothetical protein
MSVDRCGLRFYLAKSLPLRCYSNTQYEKSTAIPKRIDQIISSLLRGLLVVRCPSDDAVASVVADNSTTWTVPYGLLL